MDIHEKLINVRRANRLLAAYYRRVMTILRMVDRTLEEQRKPTMKFHYWSATHHRDIGRQSTNPIGRWGWDFLTLEDAWFLWTPHGKPTPTATGDLAVFFQHVTDDGYAKVGDSTEPDPTAFRPAEECETFIRIWLYGVARGTCDNYWHRMDENIEASIDDETFFNGMVHQIERSLLKNPSGDALAQCMGWRVSMADLETEDAVQAKIIEPLRAALDTIAVPTTR